LEETHDQNNHPDRGRHGMRQLRLLHFERRQRRAQRIYDHSEQRPDEEVTAPYERCQPSDVRTACPYATWPPIVRSPAACPRAAGQYIGCPCRDLAGHNLPIAP
jgi:hypothetical protein